MTTFEVVEVKQELIDPELVNTQCRFSPHPHHRRCQQRALYVVSGLDVTCHMKAASPVCQEHVSGFFGAYQAGSFCWCTGHPRHRWTNIRVRYLA
jgi:hypothetical protein